MERECTNSRTAGGWHYKPEGNAKEQKALQDLRVSLMITDAGGLAGARTKMGDHKRAAGFL